MPFRTQILDAYVHVSWHGTLVAEDLAEFGREMPRIGGQLRRAPNVLHTFDGVAGTKLKFEAVHNYSAEVAKIVLPNACRVAVVASSPISFGITRMFQAMNGNPKIEMAVFESTEQAIDWLQSSKP